MEHKVQPSIQIFDNAVSKVLKSFGFENVQVNFYYSIEKCVEIVKSGELFVSFKHQLNYIINNLIKAWSRKCTIREDNGVSCFMIIMEVDHNYALKIV